jgi:shikimate dehydrogenase
MTDRYAVIGNPVAHSRSPSIHARFAQLTGEAIEYGSILSPMAAFSSTVAEFIARGGKGANVTLPFKEQAFALSAERSTRAESARAVNTLVFRGGKIHGDNTDGCGLTRDLQLNLKFAIRGRRVLLMGAGGAARGVLVPLLEEHPDSLTLANRSLDKARQLVDELPGDFACKAACSSYNDLAGRSFDLLINATSAGLSDTPLPLPPGLFASGSLAYDMVYGRDTAFLRQARNDGAATVSDGLGMLVEQAAESFFIWRGVRPPTGIVLSALRSA